MTNPDFVSDFTAEIAREDAVCAHNYAPLPVMLRSGHDVWLYDTHGRKYLDMMSAYSAVSHGHCHPKLVQSLTEQAQKLCITSRAFHAETLAPFLEKLTSISGFAKALPMNSGAEAVETAIKAARRWGYRVKNIPDNMAEILVCNDNFHGRTSTIVGFSSEPSYQSGFGPFAPGFRRVPFGDIAAMQAAITPNTCAILIEPIQGEAGIIVPPDGYLRDLRRLCDDHHILLILDEIQSGLGRTGKLFCFEHEQIRPDGLILGKALGGGILPVSAFLANDAVMSLFDPGSHGSTFGGNPLAAAVGLAALNVLEDEKLCENSAIEGEYLKSSLQNLHHPLIADVRGRGLWVGLQIIDSIPARKISEALLARGILAKDTHGHTLRLAPPLTITRDPLNWAVQHIKEVLDSF